MHNTEVRQPHNVYYDECETKTDHAPIDSVILAIWLKRLLLTNSPNLIYSILSPFIHAKNGMVQLGKDMSGNPFFVTSTPRKPAENSFNYSAEIAAYNSWVDSMKTLSNNVLSSMKEGGVLTTPPDVSLEPVESAKSVSENFIKMLIDQLHFCKWFRVGDLSDYHAVFQHITRRGKDRIRECSRQTHKIDVFRENMERRRWRVFFRGH
jgi:hypothetical protein